MGLREKWVYAKGISTTHDFFAMIDQTNRIEVDHLEMVLKGLHYGLTGDAVGYGRLGKERSVMFQ
jgi:hypothetical protein